MINSPLHPPPHAQHPRQPTSFDATLPASYMLTPGARSGKNPGGQWVNLEVTGSNKPEVELGYRSPRVGRPQVKDQSRGRRPTPLVGGDKYDGQYSRCWESVKGSQPKGGMTLVAFEHITGLRCMG